MSEVSDWALLHKRSVQPFAVWSNGFSEAELDSIIALGAELEPGKATVADQGRAADYDKLRITETAWIVNNPRTHWLYQRLWQIAHHLNQTVYRLDLTGMTEALQYTVYDDAEGGHYDWHVDHSTVTPAARKLSLVLQLSDPADYQGCELQIRATNSIDTAPLERGAVIAFPSYVLHRVTPIVSGKRRSLVSWVSGPLLR